MIYVFLFSIFVTFGMWLARQTRKRVFASAVCLTMVCIAGLRHGYIDTRAYRQGFEALIPHEVLSPEFLFNAEHRDRGFSVLSALIKLVWDNSQFFLFVISLITVGCLFWAVVQRAPRIDLGVFFLVATGCYLDTMNGIRQCLVAAVLFYYLPRFLERKQPFHYVLLVLLMSTIHASALLFLPIYLIADKRAWSKYTWILLVVCLISYIFYNSGVGQTMADFLDGTSYGSDYSDMLLAGNTSVNVIRVLVAAVPVALSFLGRGGEWRGATEYNIAFNMSVINLMVWLFATRALYFYRLAMYFTPYMILLLCYELDAIRDAKSRRLMQGAAVICYLLFHLYSCYTMGDALFVGYLKY